MNHNKVIMLSFSLLLSNAADASASRTCLQRTYRATKRVIVTGIVGTYIHQNIMTEQDLTKLPSLSIEEIAEYKNKLELTLQNGCASFDKTYSALKKLTSGIKPSANFGATASFVDTDIQNDVSQFQNQKNVDKNTSIEPETHREVDTTQNYDNNVNSERRD